MKKNIIFKLTMSVAIVAFLILSPNYLSGKLYMSKPGSEQYTTRNQYSGVISVWHVVGFKPKTGGIGSALQEVAAKVEKRHFGTYFSVESITLEEYEKRLESNINADIISFPSGVCYLEQLKPMEIEFENLSKELKQMGSSDDNLFALPYLASQYYIFCNTELLNKLGLNYSTDNFNADNFISLYADVKKSLASGKIQNDVNLVCGNEVVAALLGIDEEVFPLEDFKNKKSVFAFAETRFITDLTALQGTKKHIPFEYTSAGRYTDLIQLIGISSQIDTEKISYAKEFIYELTLKKHSETLTRLGLICLLHTPEEKIQIQTINTFDYQRYKQEIYKSARAANKSETEKKVFEQRWKELVYVIELG